MQKTNIILQDVFLNQVRKEKVDVAVKLLDGSQMDGVVKGFDNFTIILESDKKQIIVYKHAISVVIPKKSVFVTFAEKR